MNPEQPELPVQPELVALGNRERVVWAAGPRAVAAAVARAVHSFQTFDPLAEVLVVTPAGPTADTVRSLLPSVADGGGIAGLRFTTVPDLALDLAEPAVRQARPVTSLLLSAAVAHELATDCPPALGAQGRQPATVTAIADAAERLAPLPVGAAATNVLHALGASGAVRRAVVEVGWRARAALRRLGLRDEGLTLASATAALQRPGSLVVPVVVVATDVFPPAHLRFVGQLVQRAPAVIVVATAPVDGDDDRRRQLRSLIGAEPPSAGPLGAPALVLSCPDEDEESREVVRRVLALVTGPHGCAPQQVAVLYPPHAGYGRRLRDEMNRAGLAWSGPSPETLASSLAGQTLRALVECLVEGCDRARVMRLVTLAPLWPTVRAPARPVAEWQALCRRLGLVRPSDWQVAASRLDGDVSARLARAASADDSVAAPGAADARARAVLGQLTAVAAQLEEVGAALRDARTWAAIVELLETALRQHLGTELWREGAWADAPAWQRRAATRVERKVRSLAALDDLGPAARADPASLPAVVASLLDSPAPNQAGVGVRLLPLSAGVCLDADHVFVLGVNEGVLPGRAVDDLVVDRQLPDIAASWLPHRAWNVERDRRSWHALLTGGAVVTASYARTDLRHGGEQYKSAWVSNLPAGVAEVVHRSHADGVQRGEPLTMAELLARTATSDGALVGRPGLQRRAASLRGRLSPVPTPFDGMIGRHDTHDPTRSPQAITNFERYAKCPTSQLVRSVFGVRPDDDALDLVEMTPLDKGNLVHAVLEAVASEWLARVEPRPPWLGAVHRASLVGQLEALLHDRAEELAAQNRLGHRAIWQIQFDLALTAINQALDLEVQDGVQPIAVEHAFGPGLVAPPVDVDTGVGVVSFNGRIDRVDRMPDGTLRVTDFKTSNKQQKVTIGRDLTQSGQRLQLPLYARAAARDLGGDGQPVSMRYLYLRRGMAEPLAMPDEAQGEFDRWVDLTATDIADGRFGPAEPDQMYGCATCSPDGLGLAAVADRAAVCRRPVSEIDTTDLLDDADDDD